MGNKYHTQIFLSFWGFIFLAACTSPTVSPIQTEQTFPSASPPPSSSPVTAQPSQTGEPTMTPTSTSIPQTPAEPSSSPEGNADVLFVRAVFNPGGNNWTFHVTVSHPDTGWEDYADGWDVVTPDGAVLKPDPASPFTRLLLHPHETEQPFTRSQSGIQVPAGINVVTVRAHDIVSGFGGKVVAVDLTRPEGTDFEVSR